MTTPEHAQQLAAAIVAWLVDEQIIDDEQCDGCSGEGLCYRPGRHFMRACGGVETDASNGNYASHSTMVMNGMRVVTRRDVVINMQGQFGPVPCPRCGTPAPIDAFWQAGSDWCEGKTDVMQCQHCGQPSALPHWVHPEASFVVLAFEFWNWSPLSAQFIEAVRQRLGHRISLIDGKL
ncbi:hypothetical protein LP419_10890 [Massilia sp. H-1]|nr:hypothetical protein LP419_10890 [Massilia sp. H-1]